MQPPSLAVLEEYITVQDVATPLLRRDSYTSDPALRRELFQQCCKKKNHHQSLKQEARDYVYTFKHPEEYTLTESIGDEITLYPVYYVLYRVFFI